MTIPQNKIYPRTGDEQTVYLKSVVNNPNIEIGEYTMYNDFVNDPRDFEKNCVLYHYPINHDRLKIGKFCSIACGAKFLFNCANHTLKSLSTYTFPLFFEEWGLDKANVAQAWDNKGDIVIGETADAQGDGAAGGIRRRATIAPRARGACTSGSCRWPSGGSHPRSARTWGS